MPILPLILYPSSILRKMSEPVLNYSEKTYAKFIKDMQDTMLKNKGIGLAAPQIGNNTRIAIIQTKDGVLPLINPEIIKESLRKEISEEGCLSIPGIFGLVKRSKKIRVSSLNEIGERMEFDASGLFARVILHEIDHLDGVLFIDRAEKITSGEDLLKNYESKKS